MRRSRLKVTVTEHRLTAADIEAINRSCAKCATCAGTFHKPPAFEEKSANAERCVDSLAQVAQLPTKGEKVLCASGANGTNPELRQLRQATLSSLLCKEELKKGIIRRSGAAGATCSASPQPVPDEILAWALGGRPPDAPPTAALHRCNDCMFGDPPAPPADTLMGWHQCLAGRSSGFGNALRPCSAWMPVTGNTPSAKEATP